VPIDAHANFTGSQADLLGPYALLGGVTWLVLCAAHGAVYLTLRSTGDVLDRSWRVARWLTPAAAAATAAFVMWTLVHSANTGEVGVSAIAAAAAALVAVVAVPVLVIRGRAGWAFAASAVGIALLVVTLFLDLYPNVLVSSSDAANSLTIGSASSGSYTLKVMTVVAAVMLPVILVSQSFAYWVFRHRVSGTSMETVKLPHTFLTDDRPRPRDPAARG
jgi:cytochrome d ubiquinol oxidase subunit II